MPGASGSAAWRVAAAAAAEAAGAACTATAAPAGIGCTARGTVGRAAAGASDVQNK